MTEPHGARVTTIPMMGKKMRPVSNLPKVSEDGEPTATPRVKGVPVEATQTTNPTMGGRQAQPGAGTSGNAPAGPRLLAHIGTISSELQVELQPPTHTAEAAWG